MSDDNFRDKIDLAAASLGGVALLANDEFFAEKDNLLRAAPAVWKDHEYTDRGKWMDGWETRRRREPGYDWCIVRLGVPGQIHGIVVDTAFFRGNFPEMCSVEACAVPGNADLTAVIDPNTRWTELVAKSPLQGDHANAFAVTSRERFTHVRLNIFPDGGVARLRVHGEVRPDWAHVWQQGGLVDLAAVEHGGWSESCSDMFFGARQQLLGPGRPFNMSDGWETRRRRGPGHDWNIIRLGARGTVRRLDVDTTHFRGNAPGQIMVEAQDGDGPWRVLLPQTPTQPHTRHVFGEALRVLGPVTRVRLNVYPCGGVARLRAFAELAEPDPAKPRLDQLNAAALAEARATLLTCCGSTKWAQQMAALRPFEDRAALLRLADRTWWSLPQADRLEAFAAHPRIGGHKPAHATGAQAATWSAGEQAGIGATLATVRERLAAANDAYFDRFGFVFLICATGKTGEAMLAALEQRLQSSRAEELATAAAEQAAILRLRLNKLLEGR